MHLSKWSSQVSNVWRQSHLWMPEMQQGIRRRILDMGRSLKLCTPAPRASCPHCQYSRSINVVLVEISKEVSMAKNTLLFSFKSTNVCLVLFTGDKAKFNARKAFYLAKIPTTPLDVFLSEDPLLRKILAIFILRIYQKRDEECFATPKNSQKTRQKSLHALHRYQVHICRRRKQEVSKHLIRNVKISRVSTYCRVMRKKISSISDDLSLCFKKASSSSSILIKRNAPNALTDRIGSILLFRPLCISACIARQ